MFLQLHIVHYDEEDNYDVVETQIARLNGNKTLHQLDIYLLLCAN